MRQRTARADAIPKLSLYRRPSASRCASPGDSCVPASQEPTMTFAAPAAIASATSRGWRTPPSAQTCAPSSRAWAAHSSTAENWGRPTPVTMRVVHIAPGPTPTFTMSAPASTRSRDAVARSRRCPRPRAPAGRARGPRAPPRASAPGGRGRCRARGRPRRRRAAPARGRPRRARSRSRRRPAGGPSRVDRGRYSEARSAPLRVRTPASEPSAWTTGARRWRPPAWRRSNACARRHADREREQLAGHDLVELREAVDARAVGLRHDADRAAAVHDDDRAVRALGQQASAPRPRSRSARA